MITQIDDWIIDRIAQPIVNAIWFWLSISRLKICKSLIVIFGGVAVSIPAWFMAIFCACSMYLEVMLGTQERRAYHFCVMRFSVLAMACVSTMLTHNLETLKWAMIWWTFTVFDYIRATRDPPKSRRKNWRAVADKFSIQWIWLQPAKASR